MIPQRLQRRGGGQAIWLLEAGRESRACGESQPKPLANILQQGGNAVDAAVAALLALFVIEPSMTGLGGYGGSMVMCDAKSGACTRPSTRHRAPRRFDLTKFDAKSSKHGYLAVGVPGNLAGIILALRQHGTIPFKELAQAAIGLAENGIAVSPTLTTEFKGLVADIDPVSKRAYSSERRSGHRSDLEAAGLGAIAATVVR